MTMPVAGPVEQQAAATALGLGAGNRVGAGVRRRAVRPEIDPGQTANPALRVGRDARPPTPISPPTPTSADEKRAAGGRSDGRPGAAFLAQLIAQTTEPRGAADREAQLLAGRQQAARLASEDPAAEAQRRRGASPASQRPETSAGAYDRVKLSAREFAARRYGVARDADGIFFFQASSIDINA